LLPVDGKKTMDATCQPKTSHEPTDPKRQRAEYLREYKEWMKKASPA